MHTYSISPLPAPRQSRRDKFKPRPCVLRYRAFKDELRKLNFEIEMGDVLIFEIEMPKSWTQKKKDLMRGKPHTSKPDTDNLLKAIYDFSYKDDSGIWFMAGLKFWADTGAVKVLKSKILTQIIEERNKHDGI